jgi:hypothetical protein
MRWSGRPKENGSRVPGLSGSGSDVGEDGRKTWGQYPHKVPLTGI